MRCHFDCYRADTNLFCESEMGFSVSYHSDFCNLLVEQNDMTIERFNTIVQWQAGGRSDISGKPFCPQSSINSQLSGLCK